MRYEDEDFYLDAWRYNKTKLKYPEGKGAVNMCLAVQQMWGESKIEGTVSMCKDLGLSLAE